MKGLITTTGFNSWRVLYLKDNNVEDKIKILNELGYIVECDNNAYIVYFSEDNSIVDGGVEVFKSIDDIFLYMDKEGWLEDVQVAILDIDGETIDASNVTLHCEMVTIDDEENSFAQFDLSKMSDIEKIALIGEVEFSVIKQCNGVYRVKDWQGGNLGNIEYQRFRDIDVIIDRLDVYWNDYSITFK